MVWAHIFQAKSPVSGLLWLYFAILAYFDPSANEIPLRLPAERYLQPAPEPVSALGPELAQALELLLALELLPQAYVEPSKRLDQIFALA